MDLGKTYGPLPMGAWVVLIGGGLGIALYASRNKGPAVAVEDASGVPGVGDGALSMWMQSAPPAGSDMVADDVFTTNEEWARACVNYLIAQGYDAALADTAVRKYLQSKKLTMSENALMKVALAKYGAPPVLLPEPPDLEQPPGPQPPGGGGGGGGGGHHPPIGGVWDPPPITNIDDYWRDWIAKHPHGGLIPLDPNRPRPTEPGMGPAEPLPPAPPPTAPTSTRWVTVTPWPTKHSTLWGISTTVYGNGSQYPRLFNANKVGTRRPDGTAGMIKDPNLIYAGWRIYCP